MEASRRIAFAAAAAVALLVPPTALGEAASFAFSSSEPVRLDGLVEARMPRAVVRMESPRASGPLVLEGAVGTATFEQWDVSVVAPLPARVGPPSALVLRTPFDLDGAAVTLDLRDEPLSMTALVASGMASVSGNVSASGAPQVVPRAIADAPEHDITFDPPAALPWTWAPGWPLVGAYGPDAPDGFPAWSTPALQLSGNATVELEGGNVTFVDAGGTYHALRLGTQTHLTEEYHARLRFEGSVASARIAPSGRWGVAAPEVTWRVVGAARWQDASGWVRTPTGTATLAHEPVRVAGDFLVSPERERDAPATSYRGGGKAFALDVPHTPGASGPGGARIVLGVSLAALLLALWRWRRALAVRALVAGYTRISREDALAHPQRRRIAEAVAASPGVHLQELRRRLGLAWGAFEFHYRVLEGAGHLRGQRLGRYTLVFPADAPPSAARGAIPSPVARRIFALLPADGSPVPLARLARDAEVSRQLARYHLRRLGERGQVAMEGEPPRVQVRRLG